MSRRSHHRTLRETPRSLRCLRRVGIATALACLPVVVPAQTQSASSSDVALEPNQQSDVQPIEIEAVRPVLFLRDTQFIVKPRAYYMDRDRDEN
jgi:hypothetical protein